MDVDAIRSDPGKRFEFMADFVGFSYEDWEALRESVPILAPRLPAILDGLYDHLLNYDDVRRVFLGSTGDVDPAYMEVRKEHLTEWFLETASAVGQWGSFAAYVSHIGTVHTAKAGDARRAVPPRYLVGLLSYIQSGLLTILAEALPHEASRAMRFAAAWNKMLMIQLETFLKHMAPSWPDWDESPER